MQNLKEVLNSNGFKMSKKVYYIRGNTLYVDIQINKKRVRFSTQKEPTKENINWVKNNIKTLLINHLENKDKSKKFLNSDKTLLSEFAKKSFVRNAHLRREFTTKEYKAIFNNHIYPYFKGAFMEDISAINITDWQNKLMNKGLSPIRVRQIKRVLSFFYNEAIRLNVLKTNFNPCFFANKIKVEANKIKPFNLEEIKRLLSVCDNEFKQMLIILFFTGLRTGEAMALKWDNIDFENKKIIVERNLRQKRLTKTKNNSSDRIIDMLEPVFNAFNILKNNYRKNNEYIFVNTKNALYYDSKALSNKFKKLLIKAKIEGKRLFYSTRHSFASNMITQGININYVSYMLGHSTSKTTLERYNTYIKNENKENKNILNDFLKDFENKAIS